MKRIIYLLVSITFAGAFLTSCEEESHKSKDKKLVPIKITYSGFDYSAIKIYSYDNSNRLIKINNEDGDSTIIEYDLEGKLAKVSVYEESQLWSYDLYEYNNLNQIIKIQTFDYEGETRNWITYNYDSDGNIKEKTEYNSYDVIDSYYTYLYDSDGNIIEKKYYLANISGIVYSTPYEEWTYTYDKKNQIFKYVILPSFNETNINNIVKANLTEYDDGDIYYGVYDKAYVYNEDNYPIECIEDVGDERYTIEYKEIK